MNRVFLYELAIQMAVITTSSTLNHKAITGAEHASSASRYPASHQPLTLRGRYNLLYMTRGI